MKIFCRAFVSVTVLLFALGCTKSSSPSSEPGEAKQVNLAIWGNYLSPEQEKAFTQQTGIKLNITNYSSNEELLAKLQAGAAGYDVAVPSDYMVEVMTKMGFLEKLDRKALPNFQEISPEFLKPSYDPSNDYSVPYAWSVTGIAIQREVFKGEIKGWEDLLTNKDLAGKIGLLDDAREALGAALKVKGFSYNSTNPEEIKKAKDLLIASRSQIKMFRSDLIDPLVGKEVAATQVYMTDANQAWKKSGGKVDFVIPKEGTTFAIDNLVILKGAPHMQAALTLINFFLDPKVNAEFVKTILAGPVLKKTRDLLTADVKARLPSEAILKRLEKIHDLGEGTRLYDEAWTEIKSK